MRCCNRDMALLGCKVRIPDWYQYIVFCRDDACLQSRWRPQLIDVTRVCIGQFACWRDEVSQDLRCQSCRRRSQIWRREKHEPPQVRHFAASQSRSCHDRTHAVRHDVETPFPGKLRIHELEEPIGMCINRAEKRKMIPTLYPESQRSQAACDQPLDRTLPAKTMHENDQFL